MWLLLSLLVFGGDCDRLSSYDYRTREAAHRRLLAAGWLAAPAVDRTSRAGETFEGRERAAVILGRLPRLGAALAPIVYYRHEQIPDEFLTPMLPYWDVWAELTGVPGRYDAEWVCRQPYRSGTIAGDMRVAINESRSQQVMQWSKSLSTLVSTIRR